MIQTKQREIKKSAVSLVEIDLTREGKRVLLISPERIPPTHRTTYQVCVRRGYKPSRVEVYRAPLRASLPIIKIPLREGDADVPLDLQALIDLCYEPIPVGHPGFDRADGAPTEISSM